MMFIPRITAGLVASLLAGLAIAQQVVPVKESDTVVVPVSIRDQTHIRVDRSIVKDVLGDVYDPAKNPAGRVTVIQHEDGDVFVKPVIQSQGMPPAPGLAYNPLAPIKLDFKTSRGDFGLQLQPMDVPGNTVVVQLQGGAPQAANPSFAKAGSHLRQVKAMTLLMANPAMADGIPGLQQVSAQELNQEVGLWREARFVLRRQHFNGDTLGETYDLTNVSDSRMLIDERELYADGVIAISALRLQLEPGETTQVWILRQAPARH